MTTQYIRRNEFATYYYKDPTMTIWHREDSPAIMWHASHVRGNEEWWYEGRMHRLDGPALEHVDGTKEWWIFGMQYTQQQFEKLTNRFKYIPTLEQIASDFNLSLTSLIL